MDDLPPVSLDQLKIFASVVQAGSFSAAARRLGRAQSVVTYTVQRLEEAAGVALFDRGGYRPVLTDAGRALLPYAARVVEDLNIFTIHARALAGGLEAEIRLVIDSMFPPAPLVAALARFQAEFPAVHARLEVEPLGEAVRVLREGSADLGVVAAAVSGAPDLVRTPVQVVDLVTVAAEAHPLAQMEGQIPADVLRDHVQLVLTDRAEFIAGGDFRVAASRSWRVPDLGAKHALLLAGLGWGSMPRHMVEADLDSGRLVGLRAADWDGAAELRSLPMVLAHRADRALGPAGRWLLAALQEEIAPQSDP